MLKLIAALFMFIDHLAIAVVDSPTLFLGMRLVGRLAMPLFAYKIALGFMHTRHFNRYLTRIGIMTLAAQLPFTMLLYGDLFITEFKNSYGMILFSHWNIGLTFWCSLLILKVMTEGVPSLSARENSRKPGETRSSSSATLGTSDGSASTSLGGSRKLGITRNSASTSLGDSRRLGTANLGGTDSSLGTMASIGQVIAVIGLVFVASFGDYGLYGMGMVLTFYFVLAKPCSPSTLFFALLGLNFFNAFVLYPFNSTYMFCMQLPTLLVVPLIQWVPDDKGFLGRNFFYYFYPLHMLLLACL